MNAVLMLAGIVVCAVGGTILEERRPSAGRIAGAAVAIVAGLVLMFGGLHGCNEQDRKDCRAEGGIPAKESRGGYTCIPASR